MIKKNSKKKTRVLIFMLAYNAAKKFNPTAIMTQWCEQTTHLYAEYPAKKFTYYGLN